ncbi:MAG: bifunctional N-acetylglucosamine-1-phosphate uridyltransferase/glucosamine-1-phosphate acetyltransferase [Planctomycetaceae bacterium]|nr:bifunctional N-acetylglucosamine-1-phosphate uridyltransferase/glucosamine-1-phosphate acetyltransferase [Planctomycetaceae bacterium]
MNAPVAVILAAGKSTRMKSDVPKVLHEVCGRPMIEYVLDAARGAGCERIVAIVGHQAEMVKSSLKHHPDVQFALQTEQKGTGHAVMMARPNLEDHQGPVMVLTGDAPLMKASSMADLLGAAREATASCVIGTAVTENNFGLGRIVRSGTGEFLRIVEEKDASPEEKKIREINVGCYVFDGPSLFSALDRIRPNNKQGELYLTDCAAIIKSDGKTVIAADKLTIIEAMGVNTRAQLAEVQEEMQRQTRERLMTEGVTIYAPALSMIDPRAQIEPDTVIHPYSTIDGPCFIGKGSRIGPHAHVPAGSNLPPGSIVRPFQTP